MKTHVLILSKTFPATHPKAGQPTYFNQKLMRAVCRDSCDVDVIDREWIKPSVRDRFIPAKLHTIRGNYERWLKIITEVRNGEAVLSVRQWTGKPYNSKHEEIQRFTYADNIAVQKLEFLEYHHGFTSGIWISGHTYPQEHELTLAQNDGLSLTDWRAWFAKEDKSQSFAIIQFTSFRY